MKSEKKKNYRESLQAWKGEKGQGTRPGDASQQGSWHPTKSACHGGQQPPDSRIILTKYLLQVAGKQTFEESPGKEFFLSG